MWDDVRWGGGPNGRRRFLKSAGLAAAGLTALRSAPTAAIDRRDVPAWDGEADVIVVGSGAAGISAAIEARRHRANVLVLELFHIPGGSSSLSGGVCYLGGGTPLQKALGFADTPENMYAYMIAAGGPYASTDKVQLYCEQSLDHFDWLVGNGVEYARVYSDEKELAHHAASLYHSGSERNHPFRDLAPPAPRGHVPPAENMMGGQRLMHTLLASAEKHGVVVRTRVSCERLVTESDGAIGGVAVLQDGRRRHLRARKGVVLAAGGFIHNPEMLKRHAPELYPCSGHWGRAGDLGMGIRMGMGVGGNVLRMHHGFAVLPLYPPENVLKGVAVNRLGQRCIAEDAYYGSIGHEFLFNQGGRGWLIVDADCDYPGPDARVIVAAQASSITELGRALGLAPGALEITVDYYNRNAREGRDPLLGKSPAFLAPLARPPYKAYDLGVEKAFYSVHTFGGLETSLRGEVISVWGEPIPGLYAVGRTSAGVPTAPYHASGLSIGDCTFFGRRAGAAAAQRRV
jgi:succinate dehydrogenase/fumarate reductase flavoprotein subunit